MFLRTIFPTRHFFFLRAESLRSRNPDQKIYIKEPEGLKLPGGILSYFVWTGNIPTPKGKFQVDRFFFGHADVCLKVRI